MGEEKKNKRKKSRMEQKKILTESGNSEGPDDSPGRDRVVTKTWGLDRPGRELCLFPM